MLFLRKDISEKLKSVKFLIINLKIFKSRVKNFEYRNFHQIKGRDITSELANLNVQVIGYKPTKKTSVSIGDKLGIELIELNGNRKIDILSHFKGNYSFKDMTIIGNDMQDVDLIRYSKFSVTTIDAPIELKMEAQYVSNFSGLKAFDEIGNLIIHAKRHNGCY